MPVIAINVSKKVYDYYHSLKSGERSKRFRNIIERHLRLDDTMFQNSERNNNSSLDDFHDYKLENQVLRDNIEKLQIRLTEALEFKSKQPSLLARLFRRDNRVKKLQDNFESE